MEWKKQQGIDSAFARALWRSLIVIVLLGVLCFAVITRRLMDVQGKFSAIAQARLCAAALLPAENGDLLASIDRLRDSAKQVAAVATLDSAGRLETLHPDRAEFRAAVAATLGPTQTPVATTILQDGKRHRVWGVVVPLSYTTASASRRVFILLHDGTNQALWLRATGLFAFWMAVAAFAGSQLVTGWFHRRVAHPLTAMSRFLRDRGRRAESMPGILRGGCSQVRSLAGELDELLHSLSESEAKIRRVQGHAKRQILHREIGFNRQLRRAEDRATIDPLTRLQNRAFLESKLEAIVGQQRERDQNLAVVMIDIDNFKAHNDTRGHKAGDDVLRFVGELLSGSIRPGDHAVRLGGDEFLLILVNVGQPQAHAVAERIIKLFAQYATSLRNRSALSMSAGIATLGALPTADGHALLAKADAALYACKRAGKNGVAAR